MGKVTREKFKVYQGVFDQFTLETLELLKRKYYFDTLGQPIKTGKEGDVYLAQKEDELRAIKIYRITAANFKKISEYIVRDYRFKTMKGNSRKVILAWAQKEYRNLLLCFKNYMNVPQPFRQENNIIIMEYIDGGMLKDTPLEAPKEFFDHLIEQLQLLHHQAQLIHGDLSEYNILVRDQLPFIIDLGQAMSIKNSDDFDRFRDLFERDIANIVKYFNKRYDLDLKEEEIQDKILSS